jgi:hypothetical protein
MVAGVLFRQSKLDWGVDLLQRGEQIQKMNNWGLQNQYFMAWRDSTSLKLCQSNDQQFLNSASPCLTFRRPNRRLRL